MHRALALPLPLLCLAAAALWAGGGEGAGPERGAFRHAGHVSLLWPGTPSLPNEVPRDCRGCHDYSAPPTQASPRPAQSCARCHVLGSMEFDLAGARVEPALEATRSFRHHDHLTGRDGAPLACLSCHADPEVRAGRRTRGEEPPIVVPEVTGAFCGSCHAPGDPGQGRFDERVGVALAARAGVPRPFRHAEHLSQEALAAADAASCAACHPDLARADALHLSEHQLSLAGCTSCHLGSRFELELVSRPSQAAATFVHAYHLGRDRGRPGLEAQAERLRREACAACHAFSVEARTFVLREELARGGRLQEGCVSCHADWHVPEHGRSDACAHCHAVEEGGLTALASQASNRPRTEVLRADPKAFAIAEHAHPFVHGPTGPQEDCARCHVATLERAPSRIGTQPFRHATHLPPEFAERPAAQADPAACTACHTTIAQAAAIDGIVGTRHGPPGAGASFNFDRASCDRCHGAAAFQPLVPEPLEPREALAFDHRAHLAKRHPLAPERTLTCVDCHALEAGADDWRIVSDAKVASCTLCHGHDEARAPITARIDRRALDACTHCHAPGVPARGEPVAVERARLGTRGGEPRHESGESCASCHRMPAEGRLAAPRAELDARLSAAWGATNSPHAAGRRPDSSWPFFQDLAACVDCHWGNMERPHRQRQGQFATQQRSPLERVREAAGLLQEDRYRARFGHELDGFPGPDRLR